ncbi:MAG: hypothetical protein Q9214_004927 [Letrouitia sp. 1 TL-2023]
MSLRVSSIGTAEKPWSGSSGYIVNHPRDPIIVCEFNNLLPGDHFFSTQDVDLLCQQNFLHDPEPCEPLSEI